MTQLNSHSFFCFRLVGEVKLHVVPHPPRKPEVDSARVKFHHASARVVPPWGCGAFFWGEEGRRCTGMICKGWVGFHKNILMLEVKLSVRSLLMVGRQWHLSFGTSTKTWHFILQTSHLSSQISRPKDIYIHTSTHNSIWKHMGPGKASPKTKVGHWWVPWIIQLSPPQRVVWLHHHSLANWDSNIRSSWEFDHNGLDTEGRTGRLDVFFGQKKWGRREMNHEYKQTKRTKIRNRWKRDLTCHSSSLGLEEGNVSSLSTSKIRKTEDNKSFTLMTLYEQHRWCHKMAWDVIGNYCTWGMLSLAVTEGLKKLLIYRMSCALPKPWKTSGVCED